MDVAVATAAQAAEETTTTSTPNAAASAAEAITSTTTIGPTPAGVKQARSVLLRYVLARIEEKAKRMFRCESLVAYDEKHFVGCALLEPPLFGCICRDVKEQKRVVEEFDKGDEFFIDMVAKGHGLADFMDVAGANDPSPAEVKEARSVLLSYQLACIREKARHVLGCNELIPHDEKHFVGCYMIGRKGAIPDCGCLCQRVKRHETILQKFNEGDGFICGWVSKGYGLGHDFAY